MNLPVTEQRQAERARELIESAGGLEACSEESGISTSQLQRYTSKSEKDSIPVRVIEALEAVTHGKPNHPVITRHLARRAGYVLVPLPTVAVGEGEWNRYIARLSTEASSLIAGIAEDLADDHDVSSAEAAKRVLAAHRLSVIVAEIEAALQARAQSGAAR